MRTLLITAFAALALAGSVGESAAQRGMEGVGPGCGRDVYGRVVCQPTVRRGVPYYDHGPQAMGPRYHRRGALRDGCRTDRWGRMVCRPGARPGVPYDDRY